MSIIISDIKINGITGAKINNGVIIDDSNADLNISDEDGYVIL